MNRKIDIYRGIAPGKIIGKDLEKSGQSQRGFAASIGEHFQTINAIIKGRRPLTTELSLKIEQALGYNEGALLTLQAYYDIAEFKRRQASESVKGIPDIRRSLFWDTDFDKIDWGRYRNGIIQRVLERGTKAEQKEIARFYHVDPTRLDDYKPTNSYRMRIPENRRMQ